MDLTTLTCEGTGTIEGLEVGPKSRTQYELQSKVLKEGCIEDEGEPFRGYSGWEY